MGLYVSICEYLTAGCRLHFADHFQMCAIMFSDLDNHPGKMIKCIKVPTQNKG